MLLRIFFPLCWIKGVVSYVKKIFSCRDRVVPRRSTIITDDVFHNRDIKDKNPLMIKKKKKTGLLIVSPPLWNDSLIYPGSLLLHVEKLLQSPRLSASININLPVIRHGCLQDERSQCRWGRTLQLGAERDWGEWTTWAETPPAAAEEDVSCFKSESTLVFVCVLWLL